MSIVDDMVISMLQKMTGLSPDEMQALANKAIDLLNTIGNDMAEIKVAVSRLENILAENNGKVIEHVGNESGSDPS